MQDAYVAADLAVARSGAASLTELAYFKLPSILIPYPHAAEDHQTFNARIFSEAGAAVLLPEREANAERLAGEIRSILDEPSRREAMCSASASLSADDAAQRVAQVLLHAVEEGGGR
ncbi:MAG: UDP-N-acetylglucosamine--N-acetylmuramyl-(pentapeptide) pyrophosphoryl-undecaprenol N-acetylglucosamine transferase, partial [Verrucomicrobia bacterium]|nr:UDP-N-acetylglucosamine--N-acetylmuramyl-(pentapeptide) pyrophosphoryl-undecaprenol N-acetylglucosamine transferase [Verrucomicrobiota bacterium]